MKVEAGLARTATVLLDPDEVIEMSRLRFLTRPKFMKMSRSREISSDTRFRRNDVAVKS